MLRRDFIKLVCSLPFISLIKNTLKRRKKELLGMCFSDTDEDLVEISIYPEKRRNLEDKNCIDGMLWWLEHENCVPTNIECQDLGKIRKKCYDGGFYYAYRTLIIMHGYKNKHMPLRGEIEFTRRNGKTVICNYDLNNNLGVLEYKSTSPE